MRTLQDPMLKFGWHTGAIVPELEREIEIQNSEPYQNQLRWLRTLTTMIEQRHDQAQAHPLTRQVIDSWVQEQQQIRFHSFIS